MKKKLTSKLARTSFLFLLCLASALDSPSALAGGIPPQAGTLIKEILVLANKEKVTAEELIKAFTQADVPDFKDFTLRVMNRTGRAASFEQHVNKVLGFENGEITEEKLVDFLKALAKDEGSENVITYRKEFLAHFYQVQEAFIRLDPPAPVPPAGGGVTPDPGSVPLPGGNPFAPPLGGAFDNPFNGFGNNSGFPIGDPLTPATLTHPIAVEEAIIGAAVARIPHPPRILIRTATRFKIASIQAQAADQPLAAIPEETDASLLKLQDERVAEIANQLAGKEAKSIWKFWQRWLDPVGPVTYADHPGWVRKFMPNFFRFWAMAGKTSWYITRQTLTFGRATMSMQELEAVNNLLASTMTTAAYNKHLIRALGEVEDINVYYRQLHDANFAANQSYAAKKMPAADWLIERHALMTKERPKANATATAANASTPGFLPWSGGGFGSTTPSTTIYIDPIVKQAEELVLGAIRKCKELGSAEGIPGSIKKINEDLDILKDGINEINALISDPAKGIHHVDTIRRLESLLVALGDQQTVAKAVSILKSESSWKTFYAAREKPFLAARERAEYEFLENFELVEEFYKVIYGRSGSGVVIDIPDAFHFTESRFRLWEHLRDEALGRPEALRHEYWKQVGEYWKAWRMGTYKRIREIDLTFANAFGPGGRLEKTSLGQFLNKNRQNLGSYIAWTIARVLSDAGLFVGKWGTAVGAPAYAVGSFVAPEVVDHLKDRVLDRIFSFIPEDLHVRLENSKDPKPASSVTPATPATGPASPQTGTDPIFPGSGPLFPTPGGGTATKDPADPFASFGDPTPAANPATGTEGKK